MSAAGGSAGRRFLALGVGETAARLVAFAVTVYLARTLGADRYGLLVAALTVVMYLTFVVDAGMEMVGVKAVAADPERVPALLARVLGSRLVIATAILVVTAALAAALLPPQDGQALTLYAGTLFGTALGTRFVHLGLDRAGYAAWSRVLGESLVALIVLTAVRQPDHLLRVPMAQIIGDVTAALVLLRLLPPSRRPAGLRVDLPDTLALLREARPMILHGVLGLAIFNSDFLFLRVLKDAASVGYYAVAYTLISFVQNLGVAYTMSLIPTLAVRRADRAGAQAAVDDGMAQAMFGALPVTVGGLLVAPALVTMMFGAGYVPSVAPLQVLLLLVPIALVRNVWQAVLVAYDRQDLMLRTVVWAAGVNVVLNVVLIPPFGMIGAAAATVATEGVRTWLSARYAAGLSMVMPPLRRFRKVVLASAVMGLATWLAVQAPVPVPVTIAVGAISYAAVLLATGAVRLRRDGLPDLPL